MPHQLDFRLLGPLEVRNAGRSLALGGRKQRTLLAILLLHANEAVSDDVLSEGLWGERRPKTAPTALQIHVANLRKLLPADRLERRAPGYLLRVEPEELDLVRFERRCAEARGREPEEAAAALVEALALWRGRPLADFAYDAFARGEIARLEELRLGAIEQRIEADLALGRHAELVCELETLVGEHPLRERLREQQILALYRCRRQAEALEAYRQARRVLVEELGIEPSSALKELEQAILSQDSGLALPARTERASTNLPSPPTLLIGRERELGELLELASQARLVTLTGPGGSGKTRLALEAAAQLLEAYPDGLWWVPLAALRDPALVEPTIAQALGAQDGLAEHLRGKRTLLLLDNFEQLVEAAPRLSELVAETEQVTLLVTSREPLHVGGEHQYPVPPLRDEEAVDLFSELARAVQPGFEPDEHVEEICRRLDGLPLAIELAAGRVKVLAPTALLERLEHPLPVLTGGSRDAPERQRTLAATIAWSHDLLSPEEQALFRRLAVFAGGFTLAAAEELCAADLDGLHSLVDKSLVRRQGDRFAMLATIREYALARLEASGELDRIRRRHLDFFLALAEEAKNDLERGQRAIWLTRLELEHDNCRAALQRARELDEPRVELRLAAALSRFWYARSHWEEGRSRIADALARDPEAPAALRGHALRWAALMAYRQGDLGAARAFAHEAAAGHRAIGDIGGLASALNMLGIVALGEGKHHEARPLFEESTSMREELGDGFQLPSLPYNVGLLALDQHQYDEARRQLEAVLALARKYGLEEQVAESLCDLGFVALGQSRHDEAQELLEESLRMSIESGWKENIDFCLVGLASVSAGAEELERAASLLGAAEALGEEIHLRLEPYAESTRAHTTRKLDSRLGHERFAACLAEGRSLSLSDAVSLALADVG